MLKVRDCMTAEFVSVPPSTPVIEVAHQMKISGTGFIPVCDNGKFCGLITEREIVTGIVAAAIDPVSEPARSVMNSYCPAISPGKDIIQAAKVMADHGIRVLPVVQSRRLLGLLTLENLICENLTLAAMVLTKTAKLKEVRAL